MLLKEIEKKIAKLEVLIDNNIGDLEAMRHELNRLKLQALRKICESLARSSCYKGSVVLIQQ